MNTVATPEVLRAFQAAMKDYRQRAGLTQEQMADALGFKRPRISEMESSQHVPSLVNADRIAAFFGTDLPAFLVAGKKSLAQSGEGH